MAKDISGMRFGRLVALRPIPERKNGYVMWECQCDCGNIAIVRSSRLRNGDTSSCGCLLKEYTDGRNQDITGQRFGRLVALKPTEERRRGTPIWECKCDCGKIAYVQKHDLMYGHRRSCGCLLREKAKRKPTRDLTGQRFGKLVVVGPTDQRRGSYVVWECKCDCGNAILVTSSELTRGRKTSCKDCAPKETIKTSAKDLTGQRFGMLVALRPTDERKNRYVVWECKCDCGNTAYVRSSSLTSGNNLACGCMSKGRKKET